MNKAIIICGLVLFLLINITKAQSLADSGYYYLNKGDKGQAEKFFESYVKENPTDTKIRLQLGYMYYDEHKYSNALQNFRYVGDHSNDQKDVEASKSAVMVIKEEMAFFAPRSVDLYFYNFYDSYQKNYIANFIGHLNFRVAPMFYTGFYVNVYTDSRSTPTNIYNDRYLELGGFLRYNFLKNL